MIERLKEIWEATPCEIGKVFAVAAGPWLLAEHIDLMLRLTASAGAAFYVWWKIFKRKD